MKHKTKLALLGATATLGAGPAAALGSSSSTVTVRIEGASKTLLAPKAERVPGSGFITKGGTPPGDCPAATAAGAFDLATGHDWSAKFYPGVQGGIFITSIFGEKPTGNDYWTVFVDNRSSASGICKIKPHQGEQLLFAVTNGSQKPLILKGPRRARIGKSITITAGSLGTQGFLAAARVHVTGSGVSATTNGRGALRIPIAHTGTLVLHADGKGFIRAAPLRIVELP